MSLVADAERRAPQSLLGTATFGLTLIGVGVWIYGSSLYGASILDDGGEFQYALDRYEGQFHRVFIPRPRSLVHLSLVFNYMLGGRSVWGFHQFNRLIHVLAALTLFSVIGRTLRLPALCRRFGEASDRIAFSAALLWLVHPIQTQAVTYLVQRLQSFMALFYMLIFYCLIRGVRSRHHRLWYAAAVAVFWLGIGTKEDIATAPLLLLMFDRTYLSVSWRQVYQLRGWVYLALFGVLAIQAVYLRPYFATSKAHNMGFGHPWITPLMYARSQCAVILHYLRLAAWPDRLCLDYCWPVMSVREAILPGAVILILLMTTLWLLSYRPRIGFLAAAFFVILAPTSSFVPINDLAMEHRMYLPMAPLTLLFVLASYATIERVGSWRNWMGGRVSAILAIAIAVLAVPLALRTISRNQDYRSESAMWKSAIAARPESHRPNFNYGVVLALAGRRQQAIPYMRRAFESACRDWGDLDLAQRYYLTLRMEFKQVGLNKGMFNVLNECTSRYPDVSFFHFFLGWEYVRSDDYSQASEAFRKAIATSPLCVRAGLAGHGSVHGKPSA